MDKSNFMRDFLESLPKDRKVVHKLSGFKMWIDDAPLHVSQEAFEFLAPPKPCELVGRIDVRDETIIDWFTGPTHTADSLAALSLLECDYREIENRIMAAFHVPSEMVTAGTTTAALTSNPSFHEDTWRRTPTTTVDLEPRHVQIVGRSVRPSSEPRTKKAKPKSGPPSRLGGKKRRMRPF